VRNKDELCRYLVSQEEKESSAELIEVEERTKPQIQILNPNLNCLWQAIRPYLQ